MSTHNIQFHDKFKKIPKYLFSRVIGRTSYGLKTEFELTMGNELSSSSY